MFFHDRDVLKGKRDFPVEHLADGRGADAALLGDFSLIDGDFIACGCYDCGGHCSP